MRTISILAATTILSAFSLACAPIQTTVGQEGSTLYSPSESGVKSVDGWSFCSAKRFVHRELDQRH